jgi:hypothetical protein
MTLDATSGKTPSKTKESLTQQYALADFWRTGWTRAARSPKLSPLQSEHDRVERRGAMSNHRIRHLMREFDALMARQKAELDFVMPEHINDGILCVLGTLPVGAEMRFFWRDGKAHLNLSKDGEEVVELFLVRNVAGISIPTPTAAYATSMH